MKIHAEELESFLELMFAANRPVHVSSRPGSGKSKIAEALARKHGWCYCEINGASDNIADVRGYMMPQDTKYVDADGAERTILAGKFTYPSWGFDKFSGKPAFMFKQVLIVIEEYGQSELDLKRALASLIQDRRMGEFHFPGAHVLMLSNRAEDRAGTTRDLDHIINRRTDVELVTGLEGTIVIGQQRGWSNITLAFAARNEDLLFGDSVPEKQGSFLTNRSLEAADEIIRVADAQGMDLSHPFIKIGLAGTIGQAATERYMAFAMARSKIPTVREIVADPMGAKVPSELDLTMFLVFDLASKTKRDNIDAITTYVRRLSSNFAVTYFHAATKRDKDLTSTAAFLAFAKDNLAVMSAAAMHNSQRRA